jgi:hypothetical protein
MAFLLLFLVDIQQPFLSLSWRRNLLVSLLWLLEVIYLFEAAVRLLDIQR